MKKKIIPKKPYKTRGYFVTPHAIFDMNLRNISKGQLGYNLSKKPLLKTKKDYDKEGRLFYKRYDDKKVFTVINPEKKNVCSIRNYHEKELKKEIIKEKWKKLKKKH